ncbi:centrosomal protein 20 isoform 4-T4 [Sylvia borin]
MATVAELKAVLKDTLEKRGALGQIKARIRAEVFNALDDQSERRPTLSRENLLINELIREYLEYNKYKYTASVLTAESTQNIPPKVSLLTYPKQNLGKPPAERNQKDRIPEPGRMAGTNIEEPLILQSIKR